MAEERGTRRRRWRWLLLPLCLLVAGLWWILRGGGGVDIEDGSYVLVDIGGTYEERVPDDIVARVSGESAASLIDLLLMLRAIEEDSRIAGVVARVRGLGIGWAKAQEVRSALRRLRDAGKKVVAYIEDEFGNSTLEYFVASAAERIFVPPAGSIVVSGLHAQYVFLGGLWEAAGVDMQVVKIGDYKSAGDMYGNKEMSAPHREMANSLLDSLYGQLVSAIAASRGLDEGVVRSLIDRTPLTAEELQDGGLIDGRRFLDEIEDELTGAESGFVSASDYDQQRLELTESPGGRVAVVFGVGTIMTGESSDGLLSDEVVMGAETMREAFEEVVEDESIDAVVFRVDSPGGSALASDLIWHATQRLRSAKPLIVSMSDVAGSGGYYVAAGASQILAKPGTLTGSIGVVLAKPNIRGLLAKVGINAETISRGEHAGVVSLLDSFDAAERERVRVAMDEVYELFVSRVAAGRTMRPEQVHAVGQGRVWTGEQARANGLVDKLGGLLDAIDEAKVAIGVEPSDKVELVMYPRAKSWVERVSEALSTGVRVRAPSWWSKVRKSLAAYDFPDGSILTLMPQHIEIF